MIKENINKIRMTIPDGVQLVCVSKFKPNEDIIEAYEAGERCFGESRGMGFCFSYWSMKRAVLAKYGIEWRSPRTMNPRVLFD